MLKVLYFISLIGLVVTNTLIGGSSGETEMSLFGYILSMGIPIGAVVVISIFRDKVHEIISIFSKIVFPLAMLVLSIALFYAVPIYAYVIISTGALFNILAVMFNEGKMPVHPKQIDSEISDRVQESAMHENGKNANMSLLIDRIPTPSGNVASVGDFLLGIGLWVGFIGNLVIIL